MSLIVICGATATGKSELAISLAKKIGAEIVNADSMQLYKGMDIGTAKTSIGQRQEIKHHLIDVLNEFAHVKKKPALGICLGMQLMATQSEEGNSKGLGWFEANVVRFNVSNNLLFKIPHTGWNQTNIKKPSAITSGINNLSEFYFVHSYHWLSQQTNDVLCETIYDYTFTSGVEKENIFGVQFHPEKSHDAGQQMLKNFIQL